MSVNKIITRKDKSGRKPGWRNVRMKLSGDRYIVDGMIVWIDANTTYVQRGNLLISQRLPLKPSKQLHE